ncbi:MAG TPA: GNAT family N-acetyltransferase [Dehalococcoidia bacterium]|nr:GNAT family N-acetyltransferase [Dehalococcoidia bacterium]
MQGVSVRSPQPQDRDHYLRMRAALWPDADRQEMAGELEALFAGDDQVAFVAERADGRICGLVEASIRPWADGLTEHPCAFVEGWWVDEDMRRCGIGRALIAAVEDWARARGFTELGSDTEESNAVSRRAHEALGFEERERVVYFRKIL